MVYAYDQWAQLPTKDLYDSQIMLAAISAAKDMYEKGEQAIKDFRKDYGDFMSPLSSDMDWYNKNFNVADKLGEIYRRGGDPLRNQADRAEIYRWINSRPYAQYNQKRQAAEDVNAYKKSRDALIKAGMYNPEYERQMLGGQLLEEWDGSLGNWTATSASPYLDYEQKYGHLFDKMGFEYDEEESKKHPGMNVLTKNKARMRDILSSSIPDLKNDPQYKYDLDRTYRQVAANNPDMSAAEAMAKAQKILENEIVERNYKGGMQMIEDPIEKERRAQANRVALENLRYSHNMQLRQTPQAKSNGAGAGSGSKNGKDTLGMKSGIMNTGISVLAGTTDPTLQGRQMKPNIRNIFNSGYAAAGLDVRVPGYNAKRGTSSIDMLPVYRTYLGDSTVKDSKGNSKTVKKYFGPSDSRWSTFRNYIISRLSYDVVPQDFPEYINEAAIEGKESFGAVQLGRNQIQNLYTEDDIITHSYGYSGERTGSKNMRGAISKNIENGAKYEMIPSKVGITTMDRSTGRINTYYKVELVSPDKKYQNYTLYVKDSSLTTPKNSSKPLEPVTNLDVDERYINPAKSSAIKLDQKYKASMNSTVEYPVTGTWTGTYGDIDPAEIINDDYFYPTLTE